MKIWSAIVRLKGVLCSWAATLALCVGLWLLWHGELGDAALVLACGAWCRLEADATTRAIERGEIL